MAVDFAAMVPGMPATEAEARAELRAQLQAQGSAIANTSEFSPFFRLLGVIYGEAALYLRGWIVSFYLPSIFRETATGVPLLVHGLGMDEDKLPATKAKGNITFIRVGIVGNLNIPLATRVQSPPIAGVVYEVRTTAVGTIPEGQSQALVPAEAVQAGAAYNLGDDYYAVLPEAVDGIIQVKNAANWLTAPGRYIESDVDYRQRLKLKERRRSGWHIDDTYRSLIEDVTAIPSRNIFFDHSIPRGPGSADAYLVTDTGLPSAALVTLGNDYINVLGNHGENDDLQVKAMPALPVPVNLVLTAKEGTTPEEKTQLASDAEDLIRAAFRESSAYPTVTRVAPFQRFARSGYDGPLHAAFPLIDAVDWTLPAADPEPGMELPVIQRALLDLAAVTDEAGGKVGLPATAHGIADGTKVRVSGTVNYNGVFPLHADSSADKIVIVHAYVAEVLAGTPAADALVVEVAA